MSCQPPPPPPKGWKPPSWTDQVRHEFAWAKVVVLAEVVGIEASDEPGYAAGSVKRYTVTYRPVTVYKGTQTSAPTKRSYAVSPFMNCGDPHYRGGMDYWYEKNSRVLLFAENPENIRFEVRDSRLDLFQAALREVEAAGKIDSDTFARKSFLSCTTGKGELCWENNGMRLQYFTLDCSRQQMRTFADRCKRPAQGSCRIDPLEMTRYYYGLDQQALASVKELCEAGKSLWVSNPQ
jgi:hypothetical protein